MEGNAAWMVLSQMPGVGNATFWALVERFGSPEKVLCLPPEEMENVARTGKRQLQGFSQIEKIKRSCQQQLRKLQNMGCICLTFADDHYPELLRQISDPPPVLYLHGDKQLLSTCCIAIVGSRASTSYGNRTAFALAKKLGDAGVTIVSGLALGIDAESHRGALAGDGGTIGVLGCGIDVLYPRQHGRLYKEIAEKGVIVSEYPLGTPPEGFRFPARNRIIAGLSRGVVVVEAARKSGSLITAQFALDEGREVYGVPGQVDSFKSSGVHWLLQQGAKLVQSENDILEDLALTHSLTMKMDQSSGDSAVTALDPAARQLLENIEAYPQAREVVLHKSGLKVSEFSELLLLLELDGFVEILPGDEVRRVSGISN
jgi:DNA processing protein